MTNIELLAPAGDLEKMEIAIAHGANAVYLGGTSFGLRAKAKNFENDQLESAIAYAHSKGVKVYITANIFAHNEDINNMSGFFETLEGFGADAFIISDPGVMTLAKKEAPSVEIHVSTQANVTNYAAANFWYDMGASRIILARELSIEEIGDVRAKCPKELQLEAFVHGAMCMSYSGRCMLSRYMSSKDAHLRDANLGACAHPCRYSYRLWAEDVTRPGKYMPVEENERGTDIFGAEDLCMVANLPELIAAGLTSLKIEGRNKSSFYVGLATRTYRQAIDAVCNGEVERYKEEIPRYIEMLKMASHRPFSTGFYFGKPTEFTDSEYQRTHDYVAVVQGYENGCALVEQRNVFEEGETLTFLQPNGKEFKQKITDMQDSFGTKISRAPHAKQKLVLPVNEPVEAMTLICRG